MRWSRRRGKWAIMCRSFERETDSIRCNLTEDGKAALLKLSRGDMRRALNVLQVSRSRSSRALKLRGLMARPVMRRTTR